MIHSTFLPTPCQWLSFLLRVKSKISCKYLQGRLCNQTNYITITDTHLSLSLSLFFFFFACVKQTNTQTCLYLSYPVRESYELVFDNIIVAVPDTRILLHKDQLIILIASVLVIAAVFLDFFLKKTYYLNKNIFMSQSFQEHGI